MTLPRGRSLKSCLDAHHLTPISSGEPTSWPTDQNKIPDLLDFFVTKGISHLYYSVESSLDGSSDHTPVILTLSTSVIYTEPSDSLTNRKTDWQGFRSFLDEEIHINIPMKTPEDIDRACEYFTNLVQVSAWKNSPCLIGLPKMSPQPADIKANLVEKRRLRRIWHQSQHPTDKTAFNQAAKLLKAQLQKSADSSFRNTLESLSSQGKGETSLWKAAKIIGKPQAHLHPLKSSNSWARTDAEKAEVFAIHLENVFKPNDGGDESEVDDILSQDLQLCLPLKPTSPKEIATEIRRLNSNKAPGFDLITPTILKNLPRKCITFLASLFNATLRTSYFPKIWKVSEILMIHKPGKPPQEASSYRPISLTPVLSKLWEKIFIVRLKEIMDHCDIIPKHQFGFRKQHSTIEQMHRVHYEIRRCFEMKLYCSAAFLDVQQAFDRVWHKGLLCKVQDPNKKRNTVNPIGSKPSALSKLREKRQTQKGVFEKKLVEAKKNRKMALDKKRKAKQVRQNFGLDLWGKDLPEAKGIPETLIDEFISEEAQLHNVLPTQRLRPKPPLAKSVMTRAAVETPHPGVSYNPSYQEHQDLLQQVGKHEEKMMKKEAHLHRVTTGMFRRVTQAEKENQWREEMSSGLPQPHNPAEDPDTDTDNEYKSVNPPVKNKKKDHKTRRKQKERLVEKERLKRVKVDKQKITDLYKLRKLQSSIKTSEQKQAEERTKRAEKRASSEATALPTLNAHKTPAKEPDFVDPKQLSGDLRNIQSTTNPLRDRFESLQRRGALAASKLMMKKKRKLKSYFKAGHKVTEKDIEKYVTRNVGKK